MADLDRMPIKTLSNAIEYIEECRELHQLAVDDKKYFKSLGSVPGSKKWHQRVADRYQEINQILNKLNGKSKPSMQRSIKKGK